MFIKARNIRFEEKKKINKVIDLQTSKDLKPWVMKVTQAKIKNLFVNIRNK